MKQELDAIKKNFQGTHKALENEKPNQGNEKKRVYL
jgi:hypothetical protein